MTKPETCEHCETRIHPLDLSDLHRGHKLRCHACGAKLQAVSATGAGLIAAVFALVPMLQGSLFPDAGWAGQLILAGTIALIAWLAPPGLVAGAPWVRIKATGPPSAWQRRRASRNAVRSIEET